MKKLYSLIKKEIPRHLEKVDKLKFFYKIQVKEL
jgi:hypothetical protein